MAHKKADRLRQLSCALLCILLLCAFQHAHANWNQHRTKKGESRERRAYLRERALRAYGKKEAKRALCAHGSQDQDQYEEGDGEEERRCVCVV